MNYYELKITFGFKADVVFNKTYEQLSKVISFAMLQDEKQKQIHRQPGFKFYTYSSPLPLEKEKIYRTDRLYMMNIRSLKLDFILTLKKFLMTEKFSIKIIAMEVRHYAYKFINELTTLTPVICTIDNKCWLAEKGISILMERIHNNAVKKYKAYSGDEREPKINFIQFLEQRNASPIAIPYKKTILLGAKFMIRVKEDELSQKLAFTVLGAGMLEKNSLGMGYCAAK